MLEYPQTDPLLTFARSHYFGKHRGIVTGNDDPTRRGRLKVIATLKPLSAPGLLVAQLAMVHLNWIGAEVSDPALP